AAHHDRNEHPPQGDRPAEGPQVRVVERANVLRNPDLVEPNMAAGRMDDGWGDACPPGRYRPPAGEAAARAHRVTRWHLPDVRAWGGGHARSSWNPTASSAP